MIELTLYEQTIRKRPDEGEIPEGVDDFAVEPERKGTGYLSGLTTTRRTHKLGAAVEVKDESFYTDPSTRLYLVAGDSVEAHKSGVSPHAHGHLETTAWNQIFYQSPTP